MATSFLSLKHPIHHGQGGQPAEAIFAQGATTPLLIASFDGPKHHCQWMHPAAGEEAGLAPADCLGRTAAEAMPELWARMGPAFDHVRETGEAACLTSMGCAPRSEWTLLPAPGVDGQRPGVLLLAAKPPPAPLPVADPLAATNEMLTAVITASPLAIVVVNVVGVVRLWNPAAERLFGWTEEEVRGRPWPALPEGHRECIYTEIGRTLRGSTPAPGIETRRQRKDGAVLDVSIWSAPLHDGEGRRNGSLSVISDITERKHREKALIDATERLQSRIGQDLHDSLCQQLAGIVLLARVTAHGLEPNHPSAAQEIQRFAGLIGDTVDQARDIARGLHPVALETGGLYTALRDLAAFVTPGIECRLDTPETVTVADAQTALHLYRIAQEAVINAVKHAAPRSITIGLYTDQRSILLEVSDDGRGIDESRVASRTMGLQIMKYRATAIGATLEIHSRPHHGTTVRCCLPALA